MKNLQAKITKAVGQDKLLHFFGFGFGSFFMCNGWIALLVGLIGGLGKELFDKYVKKSEFDYLDWLASFLGTILPALFWFIYKHVAL